MEAFQRQRRSSFYSKYILKRIESFIDSVENQKLNVFVWITTLLSIIFARNFLELLLQRTHFVTFYSISSISPLMLLFYSLVFHFSIFLTIAIFLHILTREPIERISKLVIIFWFITFLPSILDLLFCGGGYKLAHFLNIHEISKMFHLSARLHMRIQRVSLLLTFASSFLLCIWFLMYNREKWKAAFSNLRPFRSIHYVGMTLLGILLGFWIFRNTYPVPFNTPVYFLAALALLFSIFFAYQSAVVVNDIFDIESDKISNNNRPLVKKKLSSGEMRSLAIVYMFIALFFAINVSYSSFFLVFLAIMFSLIYSVPPLRLKRFFPISTFILALSALIAMLAGFSIFGDGKNIYIFPKPLTLLVLVIFTLAGNIKDIKDFKGDKKTKIKTIPVLLGERKGKIVIALFVFLSYILVALIIRKPIILIPAITFGVSSMLIIVKKKLSEKPIFILYFVFTIILAFFLRNNINTLSSPEVKQGKEVSLKVLQMEQENL